MKKILIFIFLMMGVSYGQTLKLNNNTATITSTGDLMYGFIHLVASADSVNVVTTIGTAGAYYKLLPTMTGTEVDGMTFAGDTVKVLTAGDYFVNFTITASGANANDRFRIKVYKNNAAIGNIGRFSWKVNTAGEPDTKSYFWYLHNLAVNDYISFKVTNTTASRNLTIQSMKVYIEKKPEL